MVRSLLYGPSWADEPPDRLSTGYGLFCNSIEKDARAYINQLKADTLQAAQSQTRSISVDCGLGAVQCIVLVECVVPQGTYQRYCSTKWRALTQSDRNWWNRTADIGPPSHPHVQRRIQLGPRPWNLARKFVRMRNIAFYWYELRASQMAPGGTLCDADKNAFVRDMTN